MSSLVTAASSNSGSGSLLMLALFVLLIGYMIFSGRRRTREMQRLQSSLNVGDEVMTTSGMLGRITALEDQVATLEVSPGVSIRFIRRAISGPAPTQPTASAPGEPGTDGPSDPTRLTD